MQCLNFRNGPMDGDDDNLRTQKMPNRCSGRYLARKAYEQSLTDDDSYDDSYVTSDKASLIQPYKPYEKSDVMVSSSVPTYQPPFFRSTGLGGIMPKFGQRSKPVEYWRNDQDGKEGEDANYGVRRKKRPAKGSTKETPFSDIAKEMEGMVVNDPERVDADFSMIVSPKENDISDQLQKENQRLKLELRLTQKVLDSEREENHVLKMKIGDLEDQVENMQVDQKADFDNGHQGAILDLQKQVAEFRRRLAEEQIKGQMFQLQVETLRKENQKCREKMKVMMFQHMTCALPILQDIGPCVSSIYESASRVADYELGTELGEGHYGRVAVTTNIATGGKFAVKVLDKNRITRFKDLQQVGMEVHVLKTYSHPNIVHLHEVIHAPEHLYLVTELCSMDLHKFHNHVGLSEYGAQQVIFGILKPLYHLHSHGVCHLDLKPENILLAYDVDVNNISHYDIRICDFGLVSMAKSPEESKEVIRKGYACGTPGFFAPEMILENMFEGRRADMWSLGCILLEVTLGFTQDWIESYEQIEKDPDAFRRGLELCLEEIAPDFYPNHGKLLDLIHRCLSIDATKRIMASEALLHPWLEDILNSDEGREDRTQHSLGGSFSGAPSANRYEERSAIGSSVALC